MKVLIVTQDEYFYLPKHIDYLIKKIKKKHNIVGMILLSPSPFGKKESFLRKIKRTIYLFGLNICLRYFIKFISIRLLEGVSCRNILKRHGIREIRLKKSINSEQSLWLIRSINPDIIISIAANEVFKEPLLKIPKMGVINLHSALLPKYRGLFPTFWVLKNNEKETGISVIFMDKGIDSGPILIQKKVNIKERMTLEELIFITKRIGMDAIAEALDLIEKGKFELIKNDDLQKTYYHFPGRKDIKEFLLSGKRFY